LILRNNSWHGLFFDFNYTFSKSMDTWERCRTPLVLFFSYNTHLDYGPSFFDGGMLFKQSSITSLPFGKGRGVSQYHFAVTDD